ncbi:MAG TPA: YHS domain-containing (seleno)protein [Flavobacterium sp.]|nr:YHS domain-containing (seleno)protein [Flavobacterium sp.]
MKTRMLFGLAMSVLAVSLSIGQTVEKRKRDFNLEKGLAIQGYDPVAYFSKKAVKGKKELAASYKGATYWFANAADREAFLKDPERYEPQYGGWCAYAMGANGEKVEVDPETYKILDGKLYLFYNAYFNNTLKSWNKDEGNLKKKADSNWKKFLDK